MGGRVLDGQIPYHALGRIQSRDKQALARKPGQGAVMFRQKLVVFSGAGLVCDTALNYRSTENNTRMPRSRHYFPRSP